MRWLLHFDPFAVEADEGVVVAGGVEILRSAAVALHGPERRVAVLSAGEQPMASNWARRCSISCAGRAFPRADADKRGRRWCGRCGIAPLQNARSTRPPCRRSASITWESIRWPSASTTSSNGMKIPVYTGSNTILRDAAHAPAVSDIRVEKPAKTGHFSRFFAFALYNAGAVPYDCNDPRITGCFGTQ